MSIGYGSATGEVTTDDASWTVVAQYGYPNHAGVSGTIYTQCRNDSTGKGAGWQQSFALKVDASGNADFVGLSLPSATLLQKDLALASVAFDAVIEGGYIKVKVKGLASTELKWACLIDANLIWSL